MRTTLDIPIELMEEAKKLLGFKSKTDVLIFSLRELIRQKKIEELKSLAGRIELNLDLDRLRKRSRKKR